MARDFSCLVSALKSGMHGDFRCLVIAGAGKSFSAGGDLEMLEAKIALSKTENIRRMLNFYNSFLDILSLNVPLVAAVQGAAIGAGLCIASACDVRVCADNAKLGFTFVKLGLHPGMGGTYFLPKVVGSGVARELLMTGRVILAEEALRIGLVSKVVPLENLVDSALEVAREISANGPQSLTQLCATLRGPVSDLNAALEREAQCQSENYAHSDFREGITAVREKRSPRF